VDLAEGREWAGALEVDAHVRELLVQDADDVEDEGAIVDDLAKIPKGIRYSLHLAAVVVDGEIALDEDAKVGIEMESPSFAIAKLLRLNSEPGVASYLVVHADGLHELGGDHAEQPGEDDGIHAAPGRDIKVDRIRDDIRGEGVALEGEEDEVAPAVVVQRERIQDDEQVLGCSGHRQLAREDW
jgi:hypothetical protein